MKTYKINYKSLLGKAASTFIKALNPADALKKFRSKFSSYKPTGIVEVVR